jgi:LAGLIDADG-like domain
VDIDAVDSVSQRVEMGTIPSGTNVRAAITEASVRELYETQGLTVDRVAATFGVAPSTILRRFRDLGIPTRGRGPVPGARRNALARFARRFEWTADLAYVVGLIATDGCLSRDGRHLSITSKDRDLLETARRCLGVTAGITAITNPRPCHRLQWADVLLHRWLTDIGLMPAKSLRLGPLRVPDEWFRDFLRGCIDGDGSIVTYIDRYHTDKNPSYVYTRVYVSVVSASRVFIDWIRASTRRLARISGDLAVRTSPARSDLWRLRYAKRESLELLRWIYYAPDVACLQRKCDRAAPFLVARDAPVVASGRW